MRGLIDARGLQLVWIRPAWRYADTERQAPRGPAGYPFCVIRDAGLTAWYALVISEEARWAPGTPSPGS